MTGQAISPEILEQVGIPAGMGIELLILQPTPFCNIDCKYCYLTNRSDTSRMSDEVMAAAFEACVASGLVGEQISLIWHAGEPLVLPVAYYENAFDIARRTFPDSVSVTNCFQTNGMLIDEAWCALLARPDVTVGVSIDGPKALHDANRVTRKGAGTWDKAVAGLAMLRTRGIPFHVISVLTRASLFFPDELLDFYIEHGVADICFNVEELEGANSATSLAEQSCEALYRDFMERFLERASETDEIKSVRDFAQAFGNIMREPEGEPLNQQTRPLAIIGVAANGDFSTFSPELLGMEDEKLGSFSFGNVLRDDFASALQSEHFRNIHTRILKGVQKCRESCAYFPVCGGGAPANKLYETGSLESSETLYCRYTVQIITEVALDACKRDIDAGRWSGPVLNRAQ